MTVSSVAKDIQSIEVTVTRLVFCCISHKKYCLLPTLCNDDLGENWDPRSCLLTTSCFLPWWWWWWSPLISIFLQKNILWLKVCMNEWKLMHIGYGFKDLQSKMPDKIHMKGSVPISLQEVKQTGSQFIKHLHSHTCVIQITNSQLGCTNQPTLANQIFKPCKYIGHWLNLTAWHKLN